MITQDDLPDMNSSQLKIILPTYPSLPTEETDEEELSDEQREFRQLRELIKPMWLTRLLATECRCIIMSAMIVLYVTCMGISVGGGLLNLDSLDIKDFYIQGNPNTDKLFVYQQVKNNFHLYSHYIEDHWKDNGTFHDELIEEGFKLTNFHA